MSGRKESGCGCKSKRTISWSWCDKGVKKMLQVARKEKVPAQARDTGVQVRDLLLLGQNMELWGETLHVIVVVCC